MLSRRSVLASGLGLSALTIAPSQLLAAQSPASGVFIDPVLDDYLALSPISIALLDLAPPFTRARRDCGEFGGWPTAWHQRRTGTSGAH